MRIKIACNNSLILESKYQNMFLLGQHLGQFRVWFSSGVSCEACHITYTSSDGKALYEIISNLRERGQYRLENVLVSKGKGDSGISKLSK